MSNIVADLLDYLEVKHTNYFVNKLYNEHPHSEDMYGLRDMLKSFNIESVGVDIRDKDKTNMYFPSIYHVGKHFVIALGCKNDKVSFMVNGKMKTADIFRFKEEWDGKTLVVTSTENAKEDNFYHHLGLEWITKMSWLSILCIPFILMLTLLIYNSAILKLTIVPIVLLNIVGSVLCYLLLQKKIEEESTIGEKICSLINERGCDAVLSSSRSVILYIYSWSEIGLAYFLANIMIFSFAPQFLSGLILVNYLAMVYGIWSVWYQATKVKKWCTLCLSVQLVIWLLGIYYSILLYNGTLIMSELAVASMIVTISLVLSIVSIHFVVKSYLDNNIITSITQKLRKFQVDNDVLKAKYIKESKYSNPSEVSSVFWGNPKERHQITVVMNPFCSHCRDFYKRIEPLLRKNDLKMGIRFVFLSFKSQYDYACELFIAASQQQSSDKALDFYSFWFSNIPNVNKNIIKSYGLDNKKDAVVQEYDRHKKWAFENSIVTTPFVLVNNHVLPKIYDIEDLGKMDEI